MSHYWIYGLRVRSAIPLPELVAAPSAGESDVEISLGEVELSDWDPVASRSDLKLSTDGTTFHLENVATFQVRDGRRITVNSVRGADEGLVRLNLLGVAVGILLHQRGLLALHASVVAVGQSAVLFMGFSGQGKSTTAAAMLRRGHTIVADDVAAIQIDSTQEPCVWPAFPELRLFSDSVASLGSLPGSTAENPGACDKLSHRAANRFAVARLPIGRIYILGRGPENQIQPIRPAAACAEFLRHSFVAGILKTTGTAPAHFHRCAELARQVPVARLVRRFSLEALNQLAEMIEDDLLVRA